MLRRLSFSLALAAASACGGRSSLLEVVGAATTTSSSSSSSGTVCRAAGAACTAGASCCTGLCGDGLCRDAGPCSPGDPPTLLASDVSFDVYSIATDEGGIYYPSSTGWIARVSKYGGAPEPRVNAETQFVAIQGSTLFFAWYPSSCAAPGCQSVARAPASGGAPTILASDLVFPTGLAVGAAGVVWTELGDGGSAGRIRRVDTAGGNAAVLASDGLYQSGLTLDGDTIYYDDGAALRSVPAAGGQIAALTGLDTILGGVGVDDTALYFSAASGFGSVTRLPKAGGAPIALDTGMTFGDSLVTDASSVYIAALGTGSTATSLRKVDKTGAPVVVLAAGINVIAAAVDDACVYYLDGAASPQSTPLSLYKVAK